MEHRMRQGSDGIRHMIEGRFRYFLLADGRVALLRHYNMDGSAHMQFGTDGPFEDVKGPDMLKQITEKEFMDHQMGEMKS